MVRAAALTPLPKAPDVVLGILDLHGRVIPVINLRKRFQHPEKEISCEDQFVISRTGSLTVALAVDGTEGVMEQPLDVIEPDRIVAGTGYLSGVTRTAQGLVLIHDIEKLLFPSEETEIARALEQVT